MRSVTAAAIRGAERATRRPLRILYTVNRMDVGGSQTHLLQVLRLLDRERFAPALCCLTGAGALLDEARATGVQVYDGGLASLKSAGALAALLRLRALMKRESFAIVHNYLLRANIVGGIAARLAGVPVVLASKRGCHERRGWELVGARLGNALSDCVTTNAEAVRDFVADNESCRREKMIVIPSGIDTERFQPLPPGDWKTPLGLDATRPVVGVVTRMRTRKGVEEFLRAVIEVRRRIAGVQVVIVGEVDLDQDLRDVVGAGGMADDLHLLGRRSDMPAVLSAFDLFVLSSHDEGMSNAILEAMAMGKPVVATDVGGTGEVVRHGESGLLVPPREVAPLADAIVAVLSDSPRAGAMGKKGREIVVRGFSSRSMVAQMEQLYFSLMSVRGRRARAGAQSQAIG
jgi:glycosyltransferase involved in cell wall biosynthesis